MKEKIKLVIVFIIGIMISVVISVYAATVIAASEVSYTSNSNTTVETGLNNLYTKANGLANRVTTLEQYGKIVSGSCSNTNVSTGAWNTICTISSSNIPAGKWLVYGYHDFNNASSNGYTDTICFNTSCHVAARNTGVNGGGSIGMVINTTTAATTLYYKTYPPISGITATNIRFVAVRLSDK